MYGAVSERGKSSRHLTKPLPGAERCGVNAAVLVGIKLDRRWGSSIEVYIRVLSSMKLL